MYDSESGLYYCSARYYDPAVGAFISKDPARADGEESAYQYCGGDPVGGVDPSGLATYKSTAEIQPPTAPSFTQGVNEDCFYYALKAVLWMRTAKEYGVSELKGMRFSRKQNRIVDKWNRRILHRKMGLHSTTIGKVPPWGRVKSEIRAKRPILATGDVYRDKSFGKLSGTPGHAWVIIGVGMKGSERMVNAWSWGGTRTLSYDRLAKGKRTAWGNKKDKNYQGDFGWRRSWYGFN